jgi:F420-non-reducing hydrogenase small subunit
MISALASILGYAGEPGKEQYSEKEIEELMNQIKDPIGTFYMYSLPASILKRKVMKK